MTKPKFHIDAPLAKAMIEVFRQLSDRLDLKSDLNVYLAGGMAAYLYNKNRGTGDIDCEFSRRLMIPRDLVVDAVAEDGSVQTIYIDSNYNPMFAILHEDYQTDAIPVDIGVPYLNLKVLTPTDLAVSKIARLSDSDRSDMLDLALAGLISAAPLQKRIDEALLGYIGDKTMIAYNIKDVIEMVQNIEKQRLASPFVPGRDGVKP
jgi:hypothetical protein